jgi:hypothetical protein
MKNMKHRIKKIEDALRAAYRERRIIEAPPGWNRVVMAQVFTEDPHSHHQRLAYLANLRNIWRFSAVTGALAMALFLYALGIGGTPDQLTILFFNDDPLPLMTIGLLAL